MGLSVEMSTPPKEIRRSLLQIPACIAGDASCTSSNFAKGIKRAGGGFVSSALLVLGGGRAGIDSTEDSAWRRKVSVSICFISSR